MSDHSEFFDTFAIRIAHYKNAIVRRHCRTGHNRLGEGIRLRHAAEHSVPCGLNSYTSLKGTIPSMPSTSVSCRRPPKRYKHIAPLCCATIWLERTSGPG